MTDIRQNERRGRLVSQNLAEYEGIRDQLSWFRDSMAEEYETKRNDLLNGLGEHLNWSFSRTKPHTGELSPGCTLCGNGAWSCLFINGKCNCRCFYCPTPQDDVSVPTTHRLTFEKAEEYSDYTREFGFNGVSISGGEPLLTFDKTRRFIETVRAKNGDGTHIWMYTNGTLLTKDHVLKLKDAGLNEIRFDISAWDYSLTKLRLAVGHIPVVTVEIPAIPEDRDTLAALIPIMHDEGVNHLNLHQLRLTPHNSRSLMKRNYTYLHGERVTVLESELTALSLLNQAVTERWKLPVNYCAFVYKNQHQKAASRKRNAAFIMKPHESLTASGFIRTVTVSGDSGTMEIIMAALTAHDPGKTAWQTSGPGNLLVHSDLLKHLALSRCTASVTYSEAVVTPGLSYHNPFREIRLAHGKKIYVERQVRKRGVILTGDDILNLKNDDACSDYEKIREGLTDYF